MPVVGNTLLLPNGDPDAYAKVEIRLVASLTGEAEGFVPASDEAILDVFKAKTDEDGEWSATLVANSLIQPPNTYYEVKEWQKRRSVPVVNYIVMPASGGPYHLFDLLVTLPAEMDPFHETKTPGAHAASAVSFVPTGGISATDVQGAIVEAAGEAGVTDAAFLVGAAHVGLPNGIVTGPTPGGELSGTWPSPTVDASHSGSTHAAAQAAAEATAAVALTGHVDDPTGAHAASAISAAPFETIEGTTVQAQLEEVFAEAVNPNAALTNAENSFTEDNNFRIVTIVHDPDGVGDGGVLASGFGAAASGFSLVATRARGTVAVPTDVQPDDFLFSFGSMALDDGAYRSTATIRAVVEDGEPDATVPSRLEFWTSTDQDMLQRLQIDSEGKVWFISNPEVTPLLDTNLYRSAANTLKTDDSLVISPGSNIVPLTMNLGGDNFAQLVNHPSSSNALFWMGSFSGGGLFTIAGNTSTASLSIFNYGDSAATGGVSTSKARGSATTPADVQSGDALMTMVAAGRFTSDRQAASITASADAAPSGVRVPGRWSFHTSSATVTLVERMRLDSAGDLSRYGAITTTYALRHYSTTSAVNPAFSLRGDGLTEWGAGGASALDTNLYRSAANILKTDDHLIALDGVQGKYLSGAGKVAAADGDFTVTPADGTLAVVRNSSDGKVRLFARANGAWVGVEAA